MFKLNLFAITSLSRLHRIRIINESKNMWNIIRLNRYSASINNIQYSIIMQIYASLSSISDRGPALKQPLSTIKLFPKLILW